MKVLIFEFILIAVLLPLNIIARKHVPKWKEKAGKKSVKRILNKLSKEEYQVLHDLKVHTEHGDITQIDHVVIAETGVFVIENKNYDGSILGSEKSARWTKAVFIRKHTFQNPFRQNDMHIKAIKAITKLQLPFVSIATFHPKCRLKKVSVTSKDKYALYYTELRKCIASYTEKKLSKEDVQQIYESLIEAKITGMTIEKKQIQYLHKKFAKQ
ncbi:MULTISPECIES: nuclease-related domain-containing protein [unclassified Bacillus (in: firmicutes)]|uniref:nuclease-related domain-containing protein n=1 Tax=unclassified Bacillus (in: firmicutes) TaxID=185979 RepID=UPI000BFA321F|nr:MULTISPECIES: nuclease-related domain-containing protein [unclassified Bacillus (in: firmicutes)]PEU19212.1 hypothetical protein CN525_08015 [Bacillus sp. AFS014408]PFW61635.1 hypothetical protein COL20_16830 [Bacillus sp. AFS075034]